MESVLQAESLQGASGGSRSSRNASSASTACATPASDQRECVQTELTEDFEIIAAYLAVESPPARVGHALERARSAIKQLLLSTRGPATDPAVKEIQAGVRKILENIESTQKPASYAAAAAAGAGIAQAQSRNTTKAVPTRHKRKITVTSGNQSLTQARRTNKELIEQLNA